MSVSFKELCHLNARDDAVQPPHRLKDLLDDPAHVVTWSTLQRVLHADVRDIRPFTALHEQGRLSDEKLEFSKQALEFLLKRREERASAWYGVYENVYEVIWFFGFDQDYNVRTGSFYRGQHDSRWRQVSTLLRDKHDGTLLDVETVVSRVRETQEFIEELAKRQAELFAATPTEDEMLAVAQHYGFPTPMLDYTASLRVAAWFATSKAANVTESRSVIGAIHRLRWSQESEAAQAIFKDPGIAGFRLTEGATIRIGHLRFVKPRLADEDNRISRQQGLFVSGFQPRDLQGVTLGSFFFWQEPGEVFEDPACNVTAAYLLPDKSPLALLAERVRKKTQKKRRKSMIGPLGATAFPQPGLFGSAGFQLQAALTDSRLFFSTLDAHISRLTDSDHIRATLGQLFDEYFRLSRIRADLGAVPHLAQSSMDPFGLAVAQLARLSGASEVSLLAAVRGRVPAWLREVRQWNDHATPLSPLNEAERIALASSVFLASWEILQYVHGDAAREIATTASGILGPLDDLLGFTLKPV